MELESAELRFKTDPAGQPTGVTVKQARCLLEEGLQGSRLPHCFHQCRWIGAEF